MKIKNKEIFFLLITLVLPFLLIIHCKKEAKEQIPRKIESTISHPINLKITTNTIINTLTPEMKYDAMKNYEFLKKIICGHWRADSWDFIKIKRGGELIREFYDPSQQKNINEYGTWELNKNVLVMKIQNKAKIAQCTIEYFLLNQLSENDSLKRSGYNYIFKIIFAKETQTKEGIYEFYMQF